MHKTAVVGIQSAAEHAITWMFDHRHSSFISILTLVGPSIVAYLVIREQPRRGSDTPPPPEYLLISGDKFYIYTE